MRWEPDPNPWSYSHCEEFVHIQPMYYCVFGSGILSLTHVFVLLCVEVRGTHVAVTYLLAPSKLWSLNLSVALGLRFSCEHNCGFSLVLRILVSGTL